MKKKIVSFLVADKQENIKKICKSNEILIKRLIDEFGEVYILNLHNLVYFQKKEFFKQKHLYNKINIINFHSAKQFVKFGLENDIISIVHLGKDIRYFKIYYLLKKLKINLIMIMNLSQIGNKLSADINLKYFFKAYKNYLYKGFYNIFRLLTILNIFPKINVLFESNLEVINYVKYSRSKKIEKIFPFLKLSYYEKVIPINSVYFDSMNLLKKSKVLQNKYICYVDTHFDHPDRTSREGNIEKNRQDKFYNNLSNFLNKISLIYKKPIIISKHPGNISSHKFYKSFEISKITTPEMIFRSDIVIFTVSSAILNAVILKKKIIHIDSDLLGDYLQNIGQQYKKSLGLISVNIDSEINIRKQLLDNYLRNSVKNYDNFINKRLILDGKNSPSKKIVKTINDIFF